MLTLSIVEGKKGKKKYIDSYGSARDMITLCYGVAALWHYVSGIPVGGGGWEAWHLKHIPRSKDFTLFLFLETKCPKNVPLEQ